MPQTLLALLALSMAGTVVLQQQRGAAHVRLEMIRSEISVHASSVAVDRLEEIGRSAFDEATTGGRRTTSAGELTPEQRFGMYDTPHNDIDDFHVASLTVGRTVGYDTLRFGLITSVSYADENHPGQEVDTPTRFKKATVKVYSLDVTNPDTVRLWQSYACGSSCTW